MPSENRRINLTLSPHLQAAFRTLALDLEQHGATPITAALARYAEHVGRANRRLERIFDRAEWNAMADVLNGCADLWDYSETPLSQLLMIRANVEDGHRLDGLGHKWFGDGAAGDKAIKSLLTKLGKLTEIEGDAIAAAVRYFWNDARPGRQQIDHATDEWWKLSERTAAED